MDQLITLLGTYFIGGYITLTVLLMNFTVTSKMAELMTDKFSQQNALTTAQTLEFDLYKIGYRVTNNPILLADSTQLRYVADVDNNGTIDTVFYYKGTINELSTTANPNDFKIYRRINSTTALIIGFATRLQFTYLATNTGVLNYGSLNSQVNRNNIRFITVNLRTESSDSVSFGYSPIEWRKQILPKNL